jgi:hypothetical protein
LQLGKLESLVVVREPVFLHLQHLWLFTNFPTLPPNTLLTAPDLLFKILDLRFSSSIRMRFSWNSNLSLLALKFDANVAEVVEQWKKDGRLAFNSISQDSPLWDDLVSYLA